MALEVSNIHLWIRWSFNFRCCISAGLVYLSSNINIILKTKWLIYINQRGRPNYFWVFLNMRLKSTKSYKYMLILFHLHIILNLHKYFTIVWRSDNGYWLYQTARHGVTAHGCLRQTPLVFSRQVISCWGPQRATSFLYLHKVVICRLMLQNLEFYLKLMNFTRLFK